MTPKKLSVVIPTYHTVGWTDLCLDCVNLSVNRDEIEVIVILNTKDSQTAALVESKYPDKIIRQLDNIGTAAAFNEGALEASTDTLCFLHTDTLVSPTTFSDLISALETFQRNNKTVKAVVPCTNYANEFTVTCGQRFLDRYAEYKFGSKTLPEKTQILELLTKFYDNGFPGLDALTRFSEDLKKEHQSKSLMLPEISHYCLCIDRQTFIDTGMFDTSFHPIGFFEKLFYSKLVKNGFKAALCQDIYVHHNGNTTSDFFGFDYHKSMAINRAIYEAKVKEIAQEERKHVEQKIAISEFNRAKMMVEAPAIVNSKKIETALFIRHGGIGDIIMTLPIVQDFRKKHPKCEISYMAFREFKPLINQIGIIDNFIESDIMPSGHTWQQIIEHNQAIYPMYDYVLDWTYQAELDTAAEIMARIEIFAKKYGPIKKFSFPDVNVKKTPAVLELMHKLNGKVNIVCAPQATCLCRSWAWPNVQSFCNEIKGKFSGLVNIILVDKHKHDEIVAPNVINLCGRLTIEDVICLVDFSDGAISTDTGVFHIASLLNKPCLGLFGSIPPDLRTKYYKNKIDVCYLAGSLKCIPCFDVGCNTVPCLNAIPNKMILDKLEKLVEDRINECKLSA